jgi:hypothetical protein
MGARVRLGANFAGSQRALLVSIFLALPACGARTALNEPDAQGGAGSTSSTTSSTASSASTTLASSSTGPPCSSDLECDDGVDCTVDVCTESGCVSEPSDEACDDGVFCTVDTCSPSSGCSSVHSDAICDDGISCTSDSCDVKDDACHNDPCDSSCDDGVFCDGVERCDSVLGCTLGPATCSLGLGCSLDTCNETTQKCAHAMPSACAPDVHLLVTNQSGGLIDLKPYTGTATQIAPPSGAIHLDIAILPGASPRWFALDQALLLELTPGTNMVKATFDGVDANSLAAGPDGFLYAAGTDVFRINANSGASTVIGTLPPGQKSSGDIVFFDGEMIISTDGGCGGSLVKFDLATGSSTTLGGDGLGCVFGLAVAKGTLFMINCDGTIGTFDPPTGEARILTTSMVDAYGADAL